MSEDRICCRMCLQPSQDSTTYIKEELAMVGWDVRLSIIGWPYFEPFRQAIFGLQTRWLAGQLASVPIPSSWLNVLSGWMSRLADLNCWTGWLAGWLNRLARKQRMDVYSVSLLITKSAWMNSASCISNSGSDSSCFSNPSVILRKPGQCCSNHGARHVVYGSAPSTGLQ